MADSTGINAATGAPLTDWAHVQQSLAKILTTRIGTRVMRRDFGSDLPDLVDRKMTPGNILLIYSAAATAIERWEPRFRMLAGRLNAAGYLATQDGRTVRAGDGGIVSLELHGLYYPRGHLGDYSVVETASSKVVFTR